MKVNNRANILYLCMWIYSGIESVEISIQKSLILKLPATAKIKKNNKIELNIKPLLNTPHFDKQLYIYEPSAEQNSSTSQRVQWWLEKIITILSILLLNTCYNISFFFLLFACLFACLLSALCVLYMN